VTRADPTLRGGWAIPAATDIAFALGVLALLGPRAPVSLKVFLTALAILDDLGAIVIIALFYTEGLALPMLGAAALCVLALVALNRFGIRRLSPYLVLGVLLWVFVLRSGIHATLAGVALALTIPLAPNPRASASGSRASPLHRLEHGLHPWVAYAIIPVFGFANAGVSFASTSPEAALGVLPVGIALGLFVGKLVGVYGVSIVVVRLGFAALPAGASRLHFFGVALLCGIGFTMSLFIGALAFPARPELTDATKIGVLAGSVLSALAGWLVLRLAPRVGPARP
jgi:NhaA family Na+:H+ antiporter